MSESIVGRHATVMIPDASRERFLAAYHHSKADDRPWRFVGGKIENGELPMAAAARELFEEVGVTAESLKLACVQYTTVKTGTWQGYWYLCDKFTGWPGIPDSEKEKFNELRWLTVDELREFGSHAEVAAVLAAYPKASTPQPGPNGKGEIVLHDVITKLVELGLYPRVQVALKQRADYGFNKYGTFLRTFDGRDTQVDFVQELLDGIMYDNKQVMETGKPTAYGRLLCQLAEEVLYQIENRQ